MGDVTPTTTPTTGDASRPEDCPSFLRCSAPSCPLDADGSAPWFPGEPVCPRRLAAGTPRWLRTQRRFSRRARIRDRYFTRDMIAVVVGMRAGASGVSPEDDPAEAEAAWIQRRRAPARDAPRPAP